MLSCGPAGYPASSSGLLPSTQFLLIIQPGLPSQDWSVPLLLKHLPWLPTAFDNEQAWYSKPTFMKSVYLAAFPAPSFPNFLSPPVPSSHPNFKQSGCLAVPLVFLGGVSLDPQGLLRWLSRSPTPTPAHVDKTLSFSPAPCFGFPVKASIRTRCRVGTKFIHQFIH